ncbi:MAG: M28 family peptidase [Acidobacteriota bacterium]|nr:M28 family peptidase [Acidobacteriota bacterium]
MATKSAPTPTPEAPSRRVSILRITFATVVILVFATSLLGLFISGPVVVRVPSVKIEAEPSVERLRSDVAHLCGPLSPRDYQHPENLSKTASWIFSEFHDAELRTVMQTYAVEGRVFHNVIGTVSGNDPSRGALVIGAHYDAFMEHPGADDNASGVAVLLELVRTLPDATPRRDWHFVAFSTEEPPYFGTDHMGSAHYAHSLRERDVKVDLMIALDGVGRFSDEKNSQNFPVPGIGFLYPSAGNFVAVVGNLNSGTSIRRVKSGIMSTRSIPVNSFRGPAAVDGVDWSDHASFWEYGMPGVLLTDTLFARHGDYHSATDTPDKLDYRRMTQVVTGLHGVLHPDIRVRNE